MNRENHEQSGTATLDIDLILQDSYLQIVELRLGCAVPDSLTLRQKCIAQVEDARSALQEAGLGARSVHLISHAQCALLDEAVLANAEDSVRHAWVDEPLQARFFGHHQAGRILYEEMRQVLREPAPDPLVLTVYKRVMMLGFLGCHRALDAEERVSLMNRLDAFIAPLTQEQPALVIGVSQPSRDYQRWLGSPFLQAVGTSLVLAVMWWVMNRSLTHAIATLGQGGV
ncbi:type VI secretion system protein TssL, short form [Xanthomonas sp. WHRI 1810A]|uniref:type VI secretion system protein TssL, short form n=1 Tax=Xanthomonas sp. WHRI 1810A TaxID=3161565 RepID=UPI0032E91DA1